MVVIYDSVGVDDRNGIFRIDIGHCSDQSMVPNEVIDDWTNPQLRKYEWYNFRGLSAASGGGFTGIAIFNGVKAGDMVVEYLRPDISVLEDSTELTSGPGYAYIFKIA